MKKNAKLFRAMTELAGGSVYLPDLLEAATSPTYTQSPES